MHVIRVITKCLITLYIIFYIWFIRVLRTRVYQG
nr:MAG TPA: hypothetical protein [Caudoviricetes sp.]